VWAQRNSFNLNTWLSHAGSSLLPLRGLVAHRDKACRVQSLISALVERMLWPCFDIYPRFRPVCRAPQPRHPSASRSDRAPGEDPGPGEASLRAPLALFHVYHNCVLPHAGLRQPRLIPEPTHGCGSAKVWPVHPGNGSRSDGARGEPQRGAGRPGPTVVPDADGLKQEPSGGSGCREARCAQRQASRGERGVENRSGGLMTG
jgi:hypothetical protein